MGNHNCYSPEQACSLVIEAHKKKQGICIYAAATAIINHPLPTLESLKAYNPLPYLMYLRTDQSQSIMHLQQPRVPYQHRSPALPSTLQPKRRISLELVRGLRPHRQPFARHASWPYPVRKVSVMLADKAESKRTLRSKVPGVSASSIGGSWVACLKSA